MYTLTQHIGVLSGRLDLTNAVETRSIVDDQAQRVKDAGGVVFDDYNTAHDAELVENYPPGTFGFISAVRGTFSDEEYLGLRIYIPAQEA